MDVDGICVQSHACLCSDTKHLTELLISSSDAGGLSKVCPACSWRGPHQSLWIWLSSLLHPATSCCLLLDFHPWTSRWGGFVCWCSLALLALPPISSSLSICGLCLSSSVLGSLRVFECIAPPPTTKRTLNCSATLGTSVSLYWVLPLKLLSFFVISLAWVELAPLLLPTTPLWWSRRSLILGLQGLLLSAALHYLVLDSRHVARSRPLLRGVLEATFHRLADFVGLSLQVETEFNVPGRLVSGQRQSKRGGFTHQTGPQLWICVLATTLWLVLLGWLGPLSSGPQLPTGGLLDHCKAVHLSVIPSFQNWRQRSTLLEPVRRSSFLRPKRRNGVHGDVGWCCQFGQPGCGLSGVGALRAFAPGRPRGGWRDGGRSFGSYEATSGPLFTAKSDEQISAPAALKVSLASTSFSSEPWIP